MKTIIKATVLGLISLLAFGRPVLAADAGPTFSFNKTNIPFTNLGDLLRSALLIIFLFSGVLAFVFVLIGGIQWITAGGDKIAANNARDRITAAVVGLVIIMATFGITWLVTAALGINIFSGTGISIPSPKENPFAPIP
jgi:hypothetical protein